MPGHKHKNKAMNKAVAPPVGKHPRRRAAPRGNFPAKAAQTGRRNGLDDALQKFRKTQGRPQPQASPHASTPVQAPVAPPIAPPPPPMALPQATSQFFPYMNPTNMVERPFQPPIQPYQHAPMQPHQVASSQGLSLQELGQLQATINNLNFMNGMVGLPMLPNVPIPPGQMQMLPQEHQPVFGLPPVFQQNQFMNPMVFQPNGPPPPYQVLSRALSVESPPEPQPLALQSMPPAVQPPTTPARPPQSCAPVKKQQQQAALTADVMQDHIVSNTWLHYRRKWHPKTHDKSTITGLLELTYADLLAPEKAISPAIRIEVMYQVLSEAGFKKDEVNTAREVLAARLQNVERLSLQTKDMLLLSKLKRQSIKNAINEAKRQRENGVGELDYGDPIPELAKVSISPATPAGNSNPQLAKVSTTPRTPATNSSSKPQSQLCKDSKTCSAAVSAEVEKEKQLREKIMALREKNMAKDSKTCSAAASPKDVEQEKQLREKIMALREKIVAMKKVNHEKAQMTPKPKPKPRVRRYFDEDNEFVKSALQEKKACRAELRKKKMQARKSALKTPEREVQTDSSVNSVKSPQTPATTVTPDVPMTPAATPTPSAPVTPAVPAPTFSLDHLLMNMLP
ncbi:hypothetical protein EDC01DRAFT_777790 [Geopyxis carbonaria]|nr:hypothetical protein EDC01DRAFT_777790 [Geopyxis carbonaria]